MKNNRFKNVDWSLVGEIVVAVIKVVMNHKR